MVFLSINLVLSHLPGFCFCVWVLFCFLIIVSFLPVVLFNVNNVNFKLVILEISFLLIIIFFFLILWPIQKQFHSIKMATVNISQ